MFMEFKITFLGTYSLIQKDWFEKIVSSCGGLNCQVPSSHLAKPFKICTRIEPHRIMAAAQTWTHQGGLKVRYVNYYFTMTHLIAREIKYRTNSWVSFELFHEGDFDYLNGKINIKLEVWVVTLKVAVLQNMKSWVNCCVVVSFYLWFDIHLIFMSVM